MPSELQRVAGELLACIDRIPDMTGYLQRMAQRCREQAANLCEFGSSNPGVARAAAQLDAAARACDEAAEFAGRVPPRARGWVEQMVSGERTTAKPGGNPGSNPGRNPTPNPEPSPGSGGDEVAGIMRRLPDRDDSNSDPTTGIFIDQHGNEKEVVSGRGDYLERRALALCKAKGWPAYDRTSHTEIKIATHMRLSGIRHATLYLNKEPCKIPGNNCRKLLPDFLPPGASLVIYGPNGYKDTFYGEQD